MLLEKKRVLIVVRTYPTPAKTGVEVSCTAGISEGKWIRLFPVPYRFLDRDQRFRKYQWIDVDTKKAKGDGRPESHNISAESIKIVSAPLPTDNKWQERKDIVFPLKSHCLCCLKREQDEKGFPTFGLFRPKSIERLIIEEDDPNWTEEQLVLLKQGHLFDQPYRQILEKVPYKFKYQFRCDETSCGGHALTCTDWEIGESWRSWNAKYHNDWESKFRQRFETEMIQDRETHFYVGTVHAHPKNWIITGLFYPKS